MAEQIDYPESAEEIMELKPKGGGGTHMPAIFERIEKEGLEPETCIILTDGYTDFGDKQDYNVIWGITSEDIEADHGESVFVEIHE